MYIENWLVSLFVCQTDISGGCHTSRHTLIYLPSWQSHTKISMTRMFWPIFGVICRLNHENPSRIAEVRCISVRRKSILDHTRWQSRFAREFDLFWTKIRLTSAILDGFSLFKKQNILSKIWSNMKFKSWKSIENCGKTYFSPEKIELSGKPTLSSRVI